MKLVFDEPCFVEYRPCFGEYPVFVDTYHFRFHSVPGVYHTFRNNSLELRGHGRLELDEFEMSEAIRNRTVLRGTWMFNCMLDLALEMYFETHRPHQAATLIPVLPPDLVRKVFELIAFART